MARVFKKFRSIAIRNSRIYKYLLYAIGEILLVTIGILIAVSVNNINENRKQAEELKAIYAAIEYDLTRDTLFLYREIEENNKLDSVIREILLQDSPIVSIDTINEENVDLCYPCSPLNTIYFPFTPSQKGYDALKAFGNNFGGSADSLTLDILELYSRNIDLIKTMENAVRDHALASLAIYEQKPWYMSIFNGKYDKEAVAYFLSDPDYINRLATFHILNSGNYMAMLEDYRSQGRKIIDQIKKRRGR